LKATAIFSPGNSGAGQSVPQMIKLGKESNG
jgi:hypothetical protein